jgi:TDG/mug DNA glycosylase family protein
VTVTSGFPPLVGPGARALILGTLPSRRSIAEGQYYGHPRNAFWPIMGELLGAGRELPYAQRTERLVEADVAVWDVLAASIRPGSMDADIDIATARANDFESFFRAHPQIRLVCFNGRKAEALFRRMVVPRLETRFNSLQYETLPSTSPAYAAIGFEDKVKRWQAILRDILIENSNRGEKI